MALRSIKGNPNTQVKLAVKQKPVKLDGELLKALWTYTSGTLSIVLLGLPVCAEEQVVSGISPLRTSPAVLELNAPNSSEFLSLEPFSDHFSTTNTTVSIATTTAKNSDRNLDSEPVPASALTEASSLLGEPLSKAAESGDFSDIAQAEPPTSQPSAPSVSEPAGSLPQPGTSDPAPPSEPSNPEASESAANQSTEQGWRFSVAPYFFVPFDVEADVTVAGRSASLNLDLGDILNLDRAFDAGLRLEAQHKRLGFILDGFYLYASESGNVGVTFPEGGLLRLGIPTAARLDADAAIAVREITVDSAVSYRVVDSFLGGSSNPYPRLVVAPILGLRTKFLWQKLEIENVRIGNTELPLDRDFRFSKNTVEPLLGAQIGLDLSERWAINFRGDVSGFNINAEQDYTWNLLLGTQYRFSDHFLLQLAYRFNGFDFQDGEGLRRARVNLYQNGLWLSGVFQF